jgi:hypothetical protein
VVFHAPVTTGSEHDPLRSALESHHYPGDAEVQLQPGSVLGREPGHSKATIQSGPNNPVGVAWIDLTKEHYGIHGTPEPANIGHVQSHGCVRLTNWDVSALMKWAQPGHRWSSGSDMRRVDRIRLEKRRRLVLTLGLAFSLGALTAGVAHLAQ